MSKQDRLIILGSVGVLVISFALCLSMVTIQNKRKYNVLIEEQNQLIKETQMIKIWRGYHDQQMNLMTEILIELKKNHTGVLNTCL